MNGSFRKTAARAVLVSVTVAGAALLGACGSSSDGTRAAATSSSSSTSAAASSAASSASTPADPSASESAPPTSSPSSTSSEPAEAVVITIKDFEYQVPDSVKPGATITVRNEDSANHTVTSKPKGAFDSLAKGKGTSTFTAPTKPGSYPFICTFHANMSGTLVVK